MIRDADNSDLPALARILGDWAAATEWMPKLHTAEEDLWFVGHLRDRGTLRVAGRPSLGFLARRGQEIDALFLAPDARGRGIGRALVDEAKAAEEALTLWSFQANAPARAFYAAMGFRETARTEGDNEAGLPDVRLEWRRDGAAS